MIMFIAEQVFKKFIFLLQLKVSKLLCQHVDLKQLQETGPTPQAGKRPRPRAAENQSASQRAVDTPGCPLFLNSPSAS